MDLLCFKEYILLMITWTNQFVFWCTVVSGNVIALPALNITETGMKYISTLPETTSLKQTVTAATSTPLGDYTKRKPTIPTTKLKPAIFTTIRNIVQKPVIKEENSSHPKVLRTFSKNGTHITNEPKLVVKQAAESTVLNTTLDSGTDNVTESIPTSSVTSAKNVDHVPMWRKDALREQLHHTASPAPVRPQGPVFRPPSAISNKYGHRNYHLEPEYEFDDESNIRCWPECRNHSFGSPTRQKRKHKSDTSKLYNYKLLYNALKDKRGLKKQETAFYAWIFGATMLTLGSLTTLASCVVFCYCGDKYKKKKKRKKKAKAAMDDSGEYQRVDSVSSMVSSRSNLSRITEEQDKEDQENSELLDSSSIQLSQPSIPEALEGVTII